MLRLERDFARGTHAADGVFVVVLLALLAESGWCDLRENHLDGLFFFFFWPVADEGSKALPTKGIRRTDEEYKALPTDGLGRCRQRV